MNKRQYQKICDEIEGFKSVRFVTYCRFLRKANKVLSTRVRRMKSKKLTLGTDDGLAMLYSYRKNI